MLAAASVRPATAADAAGIAEVHVVASRATYGGILPDEYLDRQSIDDRTKNWEAILARPEQFIVIAEVDSGVVGFANGGPEREDRQDFQGELYAIYVLNEWQRLGIGKKLVAHTAATLLQRGFDDMLVWVLAVNPYRQFYERLGGQLVDQKATMCAGREMGVVAYGWKDLRTLAGDYG